MLTGKHGPGRSRPRFSSAPCFLLYRFGQGISGSGRVRILDFQWQVYAGGEAHSFPKSMREDVTNFSPQDFDRQERLRFPEGGGHSSDYLLAPASIR